MQLLVLALLFSMLGKNADVKQFEPILQTIGGEEAANALKQAEELGEVISAVQSLAQLSKNVPKAENHPFGNGTPGVFGDGQTFGDFGNADFGEGHVCADNPDLGGYPLAPISNIADPQTIRCLSRYIALGD